MQHIELDCSAVASRSELIQLLYHRLGFDKYVEVANLDGMYDLMAPDVYTDARKLHIVFIDWNKLLELIGDESAAGIIATFEDLRHAWEKAGKELRIDYQ